MKVQLFPLNTPIPGTPGFIFDELSVQEAIAYTTMPVTSIELQPFNPFDFDPGGQFMEQQVTRFWIEEGHLWGDVDFLSSGSETFFKENADIIKWFARILPRDTTGQMTVNSDRNSFTDYYISSVGWFFK